MVNLTGGNIEITIGAGGTVGAGNNVAGSAEDPGSVEIVPATLVVL